MSKQTPVAYPFQFLLYYSMALGSVVLILAITIGVL